MSPFDQNLIARLRALPDAQRAAALERACASEPAWRARWDEIMAAASAPGSAADETVIDALRSAMAAAPTEATGTRLGPYKLLQKIGEGGFSAVWLAEQAEPVRRPVAIKILKLGMDTEEVIARFEAERQALALMDHPNIARVFDAGTTETGRPFFVMELVRGTAITRHCDEGRLPAEARLQLFIAVCQAVQHAHQKGVIHRDLKPSNILVALYDGVPVPKVIDFGIAKATGPRLTEKTFFTQFHAFLGTPAYTSPEQMEMSAIDVDTRSDIYSLGVLLYELLCGRLPFDTEGLAKAGFEALRRAIREVDPPRPSTRLATLSVEDRTTLARQRGTDAAKLPLLLRGDLDWIVMRCLEKDRARRYETANGLARDVERFLDNEPVWARPPSGAYRLGKFIRRHKLAFTAAMAIAASVTGGLIVSSTLFLRERAAHAQAADAEREQGRLRQQADTARERETIRASRAASTLAGRLLEQGRVTEALAYLVHAARKDPHNATIAPRLISVLALHDFLIPEGAPFPCDSPVLAVHFTRTGRELLAGTADGTLRTFDAATGRLERELHLGKAVVRGGWLFATQNDRLLAVRFVDNTAAIYASDSARPCWPPLDLDPSVRSEADPVLTEGNPGITLSPDGRWLAACGVDGEFWLWDAATGERRMHLTYPNGVFGPAFARNNRRFGLVADDALRLWNLPECTPWRDPVPLASVSPQGLPTVPRFSPDSRQVAVYDPFGGVHLFDADSGARVRPLIARDRISGMAGFLPDGRMVIDGWRATELVDLATGRTTGLPIGGFAHMSADAKGARMLTLSEDGSLRLWNTATGDQMAEPAFHQLGDACAALSPDGRQVALGSKQGAVYRLRLGRGAARPLGAHEWSHAYLHPPFLPTAPSRVLRFERDRAAAIDVASGREVPSGFTYPKSALSAVLEQSGLALIVRPDLSDILVRDLSGGGPTEVWNISANGVSRATVLHGDSGSPPGTIGVPFSPDGNLTAHAKPGGHEIGVWDVRTGEPVGPGFFVQNETIAPYPGISFSADSRRVATGLRDGDIVIWEVATGAPVKRLHPPTTVPTERADFSPDGSRIVAVNWWGEVSLWDVATGERAGPVLQATGETEPVFSPDGKWLAVLGGDTVSVRDGHTNQPISEFAVQRPLVARFSADGERLVTTNAEGQAQVWDVRSGQPMTDVMPHAPVSLWLEGFSPDGRFVETISEGGQYHLWSVPPPLPKGEITPEWMLQLAAAVSGRRIDATEQCIDAPEAVAQIDEVRRQLAALPNDAPYVEWGRWILEDFPGRSIAPGFTITPAGANRFAAEGPPGEAAHR